MAVVLRHVPEMVDRWLEGYHDLTMDFRRRVCLAETAFLSLCEVLLAQDPPRGVSLWRALSATMTTRYIGGAGTVNCCTSYFAFLIQRRSLNFATKLSAYLSATRIRSSLTLPSPLRTMESLLGSPQPQARIRTHLWLGDDGAAFCLQASAPDILFPSMTLGLRTRYGRTLLHFAKQSARLRWRKSCAHHWWSAYLAATNPETAYAAWVLFLRSADARASLWVRDERQGQDADSDFAALKLTCVELNRAELKRNMKMRLDQCDKKFLDHAIVDEVSPWRAVANPT